MKTPAALYPFCSQLLPVVKFFEDFQDKYALKKLYSPSGFGLNGRDAAYSRNHPQIGITVADRFNPGDQEWDVLILIRTTGIEKIEDTKLVEIAEYTLQSGKSVHFFDDSSADVPKKMWTLLEAYPDKVKLYTGSLQTIVKRSFSSEEYTAVDIPVVLVGGLVEEADTFEVLLRLAAQLRAEGFNATAIAKHPVGQLFGLHTLNRIYERNDLTEAQKILELNRMLKNVEISERPNILLIEAPDAVKRYNDIAPNGFGIRTYMLCQAVCPDYFICCVPCDLGVEGFLEAISRDFENRLSSPIHAVHVSNLVIDSMELLQSHRISYIHTPLETVREQIANEGLDLHIPLFDVVGNGADALCTHLCDVTMLKG